MGKRTGKPGQNRLQKYKYLFIKYLCVFSQLPVVRFRYSQ
jgi:hypothetical protein